MKSLILAFGISLYVLLAAWFFYKVTSDPCGTVCGSDVRGAFILPIPIVAAAMLLLAGAMVIYRRLGR